jgi:hypothetical protein
MDFQSSSSSQSIQPKLRLVGSDPQPNAGGGMRAVTPEQVKRRMEVARENRLANQTAQAIDPGDLRLIFAFEVAKKLDGGRAAILTPERRQALVEDGARRGLKPFDANLVIAMVQHAAREGQAAQSPEVTSLLPLVPISRAESAFFTPGVLFGIASVAAMVLFLILKNFVAQ